MQQFVCCCAQLHNVESAHLPCMLLCAIDEELEIFSTLKGVNPLYG